MAQFEPALIMRWIFKTAISVWLISNTFDIVMAVFDLSNELHTSTDFLLTGIGPSNDFAKEEIDTAISILSSIKQLL